MSEQRQGPGWRTADAGRRRSWLQAGARRLGVQQSGDGVVMHCCYKLGGVLGDMGFQAIVLELLVLQCC